MFLGYSLDGGIIMPTVSIIIPVYNKDSYISYTLESILAQTYKDYEVLIINDGSTDNSLDIIKKYEKRDKRISVLDIPNGGVSNARNIGLKNAKGRWIQFLDGDDLIDKEYLANEVEKAEFHKADILFSNFKMVDKNGKCVKQITCSYQGITDQKNLSKLFIEQQYESGFFGFISNKLIRKSVIDCSKAEFKSELQLAEDLDFYAQIYPYAEKVFFSNANSFYYLQTETNYLLNQNIDYYSQISVCLDIREWFIKSGFYSKYQEILDGKIAEYVFFSLFYAMESSKVLKVEYEKIIKKEEIMKSIHLKQFCGFEKWILWSVKNRNYCAVMLLIKGRNFMRWIYRRLKNGRSVSI